MGKKAHTLTWIYFLAIASTQDKWKSSPRCRNPTLHLMRKFMNSQNQSSHKVH